MRLFPHLAPLTLVTLLAAALLVVPAAQGRPPASTLTLCAAPDNDLHQALLRSGVRHARLDTPEQAVERAPEGSGVLILGDGYPERPTPVSAELLRRADSRRLRLYVENAAGVLGVGEGPPRATQWERLVVSTPRFGAGAPAGRILALPDCRYRPSVPPPGAEVLLVAARVAGFDQAVFGAPPGSPPVLYSLPGGRVLVATTALSHMVRGRYAPEREWAAVWSYVLGALRPGEPAPRLSWAPDVRPAYGPEERLPRSAEREALRRGVRWVHRSGLLLDGPREGVVHALLRQGAETAPRSEAAGEGDGSRGILEGYASGIRYDGSQVVRLPLRADCQAESAMVLAAGWQAARDSASRDVSGRLLEYLYRTSGMHGGVRGDPRHPAFGLIGWGAVAPAWEVATYGDDEARVLLASGAAEAWLGEHRWDRSLLLALLANRRTTGRRGFRGDRIDLPALERRGWKAFHDAETVNYSPSFEAYLWACNLWAYHVTGEREFLEPTRSAIRETMQVYPRGWRWGDNLDRCRMLLPLAWLVRLEDTPEHRGWLARVAGDLLRQQQPSGALAEVVNERGGGGHFRVPASNESYGTGETPLIQRNGDPVSDQLYAGGFALLGLHEAAAALDSPRLRAAEDRLAGYLCRIQVRAPRHPYLDGAWFRGFDFGRWEFWASSGDVGWGPWCVESGWAASWGLSTLALREQHATLWELLGRLPLREHLESVRADLAVNGGGPLR